MRITVISIILAACVSSFASNSATNTVARARAARVVQHELTWSSHAAELSSGVSSDEYVQNLEPKQSVVSIQYDEYIKNLEPKSSMVSIQYVDFICGMLPSLQSEWTSFDMVTYYPAEKMKLPSGWYDMFHAVYGSRAYWILTIARARAENGEPVSDLKDRFDATIRAWLSTP